MICNNDILNYTCLYFYLFDKVKFIIDKETQLGYTEKKKSSKELTKEQKVRIYKQMTIGYIFLNQEDSTDAMTNMKMVYW